MKRVAINGMGRIGRAALKVIVNTPELELVAVNDIAKLENIAYLLEYDGTFESDIIIKSNYLIVDNKPIRFFNEREPENLPWYELDIDVVIESTGVFTNYKDSQKHIKAGAKTVVLSGPSKSPEVPTVVHGINSVDGKISVFSYASCTTNNISPIIEIIGRRIGIEKTIMTTIHSGTSSNSIVDVPFENNYRMGRSGMNNLIPTTTGTAKATIKAMPEYKDKFDGMAIRVPVTVGSISDITMVTSRKLVWMN